MTLVNVGKHLAYSFDSLVYFCFVEVTLFYYLPMYLCILSGFNLTTFQLDSLVATYFVHVFR